MYDNDQVVSRNDYDLLSCELTKAKQALLETERERDAQAGKYSAAQASLNTHALIAADLKAKVDDAVAHNKLLFISFG